MEGIEERARERETGVTEGEEEGDDQWPRVHERKYLSSLATSAEARVKKPPLCQHHLPELLDISSADSATIFKFEPSDPMKNDVASF